VPITISVIVGRAVGALAFYFILKKKRIAYKNLKIAFPGYSCDRINKIVKETFMNCGQHIMEIFYLPWMDAKYIEKFIELEGIDEAVDIIENKKGTIFLGLHEGSWEVANIVLSPILKKYNYTIIARTQGDIPLLDKLLNQYRAKRECRIIRIADNFRPIVEHLKKGFVLGMVGDHGAHGGILVDFFGRPALTPIGAAKLALKLDTNFILGFMKKTGLARHKITFTNFELINTGNIDNDVKTNLENINRKFEEYIRCDPAEYLWFFKRWKYSPQRNVLVISDGKPGHIKQSLAVLDLMKKLSYEMKSDVVEIKFNNNWQRAIFQICSFFFSRSCQGCMGCLRKIFKPEQSDKLLYALYDAVISCGSSLAMVNRLIAFENMAKSIVIMKPGLFSLKRFDLAIIPEHDRVPKYKNVVFTKGALSRELDDNDKKLIKEITNEYRLDVPPLSHPVIGLLIGGDNKHLSLEAEIIEKIINDLNKIIKDFGGSILISTSRRTGNNIEGILKNLASKNKGCRMLVIANEHNPEGAIDSILYLSDILVVSEDSISMLSEAVNAKKHTVIFKLKRKNPDFISKHERLIDDLEKHGYVYSCKNSLFEAVDYIWRKKPALKVFPDRDNILKKLKEIL
jgi:KDO2-lipid IV(A) lauroyltransferase